MVNRFMTWLTKSLAYLILRVKYINQDPEVCCCGCMIACGGDICHHGGCCSLYHYTIDNLVGEFMRDDCWVLQC